MSTDKHFNQDFAAELEAAMVAKGRASRTDCHWCKKGQEEKLLFCSACQMACYCSKECQKKDWKRGGHKLDCQQFCKAPVTMKSDGTLPQDELDTFVWDRLGLFACEMNRLATVRGMLGLLLQAAAILSFDGVYLLVVATIPGPEPANPFGKSFGVICNVLFLKIDEGQAAESQICQGTGRLSKAAKEKVLKYLCQMGAIFKEHKVFHISFTYGRGLLFMTSDEAFTNKIKEAGNGYITFRPGNHGF